MQTHAFSKAWSAVDKISLVQKGNGATFKQPLPLLYCMAAQHGPLAQNWKED